MSYPTYTDILERELAQYKAVIEQQKEVICELNEANEHHRELARSSRDSELSVRRHMAEQAAVIETLAETLGGIRCQFPKNSGDTTAIMCDDSLADYALWRAK